MRDFNEKIKKEFGYAGKPKQWQVGFDSLLRYLSDYPHLSLQSTIEEAMQTFLQNPITRNKEAVANLFGLDLQGNPLVGEYCEVCHKFVEGFEYKGCCSGRECGCMGRPIEPCICSEECWKQAMKGR